MTPEEREACRYVAQGKRPRSQRALALMALDQGVTQTDAGELSRLTIGQVRYWRDRFRDDRLVATFCSSVTRAVVAWAYLQLRGLDQVRILDARYYGLTAELKPCKVYKRTRK